MHQNTRTHSSHRSVVVMTGLELTDRDTRRSWNPGTVPFGGQVYWGIRTGTQLALVRSKQP
jgi:hypothetical protein